MTVDLGSRWVLVLASACVISAVFAQDGNQFVYYEFHEANLYTDGIAKIQSEGLLQLTNNSLQEKGHAFHRFPIEFITSSPSLAQSLSFSTEFVFAISAAKSHGHGFAFVVSPSTDFRYATANSLLGLFNTSTNKNTSAHLLAVEFDITRSPEWNDISNNHVGIDVNSIISIESANASYFSNEEGKKKSLLLASGERIRTWIEYDGVKKLLNVTLAPLATPRPSPPLLSTFINLSEIFLEKMYIGFSGSTGTITSDQYILAWSFKKGGKAESLEISKIRKIPSPPPNKRLIIIVSTSIFASVVILGGIAYLYQKRKYAEVIERWEKDYSPQRFSFRTLYNATKGFKDTELIGSGGFGKVYKGELSSGSQIAVKRVSHDAEQGMKQYVAEIVSMGRLRHKNLVHLLGYCRRKGELILVYDYMPNGSLDDYLFDCMEPKSLSWSQRFHIIKGVASALLYLHEGWEQVVLHRDIKASNILLDADLNGRLGDFGLARFHDRGTNLQTTCVVGTVGYMAPELTTTGAATTCTDVYAFGAFMLEVVCGKRPIDPSRPREERILANWVASCGRRGDLLGAVDNKLEANFVDNEAELVLKLGMLCSQSIPENRPSMREIVQYLEENTGFPEMSLDFAGVGIATISNETLTTLTTTSSTASYAFDTVTVLFGGR